jgi:hypothetical protein
MGWMRQGPVPAMAVLLAAALASGCGADVESAARSSSSGSGGDARLARPETIVENRHAVMGFAIGADQVFWEDQEKMPSGPAPNLGLSIRACALAGCGDDAPVTLVAQDPIVFAIEGFAPLIATDGVDVFGVDAIPDGYAIGRCAANGCGGVFTPLVSTPDDPIAIAVGDQTLAYFAMNGAKYTIGACPTTGASCGSGLGKLVERDIGDASTFFPAGIALADGTVYWASTLGVMSCPVSGCMKPKVISSSPSGPHELTVDSSHVYWLDAEYRIVVCPVEGCAGEPKHLASEVIAFAVDHDVIYFMNSGEDLVNCSAADCEGTLEPFAKNIPTTGSGGPSQLLLDAGHVYLSTGGAIVRFDRTR